MSLRAKMQQEVMLLNMESELENRAKESYGKSLKDCDNKELYYVLLELTKNMAASPFSYNNFKWSVIYKSIKSLNCTLK